MRIDRIDQVLTFKVPLRVITLSSRIEKSIVLSYITLVLVDGLRKCSIDASRVLGVLIRTFQVVFFFILHVSCTPSKVWVGHSF